MKKVNCFYDALFSIYYYNIKKGIDKFAISMIAIILLAGVASANVDYSYNIIAYTGQVGLTGIGNSPSINDKGTVAFMGTFSTGTGIFIGNGSTPPQNINPAFGVGTRLFDDAVQINNLNQVAAKDRISGAPPKTRIRVWDGNSIDSYSQIASGGGTFDSYDAVLGPVSMNNNKKLVFAALKGSNELLVTPALIGLNKKELQFPIKPMIDESNNIVVKAFDSINLYNYDLGLITTIAGPSNGFSKVGARPGISDDGSIIVFAGDRGAGTGIFASIKEGPGSILMKIAGEGALELGNDSSGSPIYFSSFDIDSRVAAIHQELDPSGLNNDSFVVTFVATPSAASRGNFTAKKGIWTVRVDAWTPAAYQYRKEKPSPVIQIDEMILSVNFSGMIQDFNIYDPIANVATDDIGRPRIQLRGEHSIVFWAKTNTGEMVMRVTNSSDKPDLKVVSSDISLNKSTPYVNVTVHNEGNAKAKSIEVQFIKELKDGAIRVQLDTTTKILTKIPAGGFENASVDWKLEDYADIRVIVDPNNLIEEKNESNNIAETHKITGRVTEEISGIGVLQYTKVEYQEKVGAIWETRYLTFTDNNGKYIIPLNDENITKEKEGRVNVSLEFSPDKDPAKLKAMFYNDSEWGRNTEKRIGAKTLSKSISISNSLDKEKDYPYQNIKFKPAEGGSIYKGFVDSYLYFKKDTVRFEISNLIEVEVANTDLIDGKETSYYHERSNSLHIWNSVVNNNDLRRPSIFYGKDEIAHEYSHRVANPWNIPYGPERNPGSPPQVEITKPRDGLGENWANFGASLVRKDPKPDSTANFATKKYILENETDVVTNNEWIYSMADVWWNLSHKDISKPNYVVETLKTGPQTVKAFYENYSTIKGLTVPQRRWLKALFRQHGYRTRGWLPAGPPDPDIFTNSYSDMKVDKNGDGIAEKLRIDIGFNISSYGNYSIYGFLVDPRGEDYCYAVNNTYLEPGIQSVPIDFGGRCIFQNKLNGSYSLSDVYIADENLNEIDYRIDAYNTSIYDFKDFSPPVIYFTGIYSDNGNDTDSDGLYNYLIINVPVNVSLPDKYSIKGSLYDISGNYIDDFQGSFDLGNGLQNVEVKFNGASIYANNASGQFVVKGLEISDINKHGNMIYYDPEPYLTNTYEYTRFQVPGGAFAGESLEQAVDINNDSLFDYLILNGNLNITSSGIYSIIGYLADASGKDITYSNNFSYLDTGTQTLSLAFEGKLIHRSKLNGPYNITLLLYSNNSVIDKRVYTTSIYNYKQFHSAPEDYFDTSFGDYGIDQDSNGLYDYLTIETNISTENKPGNYTFEGYLFDENYSFAGYSNISSYIDGDSRTVFFNFSGQDIWRNHFPDGSYSLNLKISDENGNKIGNLDDVYITSNYSYNKFEIPLITSVTDLTNTTYSETYITWSWTDPTTADFASVNVWIDGSNRTNVPKGVQFYNATGFSPDTEHTIAVRTVNISGEVNQTWVTHTARTAPLRIPPLILNRDPTPGSTFPKNTTSVMLSLQTDKISECRLSETTRDFADMSVFSFTNSLLHFTQVTNLKNGVNYTFFINCQDLSGTQNNTESFTFYIYNRTFLPPVVEPIPDITAFENQTVTIPVNATDPENDPLTITVQDRSMFGYIPIASRIIVENQTLKLLTNFEDAGKYYLRVSVSDGKDTVTRDFTLNIINVNRPPVLTPIGNKIAIEGTFFNTTIQVSDPDGDDLRFSDNTTLFNINPYNGEISFTPKNYQVGDHYVNISVTDGEFTVYEVVLFHITNVNNPPVNEPILPQKAIADELFTLQINASDPDHDNLTFSDDTNLFNISTQGLINFTPSRTDEGKYLINITVTDSLASDTRILNLVISGINRPPIITSITDRIIVYRNQSFDINATACDPDIDAGCE